MTLDELLRLVDTGVGIALRRQHVFGILDHHGLLYMYEDGDIESRVPVDVPLDAEVAIIGTQGDGTLEVWTEMEVKQ
jgi:hypothetical protein